MTHYSICTYFNTPAKHLQPEIRAYASDRLASQLQAENNLRLYSKRLAFVDFGLQAKRTEGEFSQVFYASGNISALGHTFSVRMHVSGIDPKNPTRSTSRRLEYQILLKSQLGRTLDSAQHIKLNHVMVTPPPARYVVRSTVYEDTLSSVNKEGNKCVLNLSAEQINMVLSSSSVTFRLFLFLA